MSVLQCEVNALNVFSMDFNPQCVKSSDAPNGGCLCNFQSLAFDVRNGTLQHDRKAALFLGLMGA